MAMSKPLIGVTCDYDVQKQTSQIFDGYYRAILRSGGLPYLIPRIDEGTIPEIIDLLGGIVFTGGGDVDPAYFGEAPNPRLGSINPYRDRLEIPLCREVMDRDIPVLGICRGMQLMNIAMGGEIYQDLDSQWDKGFLQKHSQLAPDWYGSHVVELAKGSRLAELLRNERIRTNSFHHQAVREPADCFRVTARCDDGVVEGIESPSHTFAVGVQWHPERMWEKDERMLGLFNGLVDAARNRIH
ncbi:MAG TPA: gamma-glutamyl-gamma-aminobutyrate hydrolase family protein [Clostridiales bacterium]|nr:gamma-glutamyl-gamma-aminobutyrate hydrolase family protein [Clostridiales bacterium]